MSDRAFGPLIWNRKSRWIAALSATTAYFIASLWLQHTYVDRSPKVSSSKAVSLIRPFEQDGHAAIVRIHAWFPRSVTFDLADDQSDNERSPVEIYEDGKPLGPAHSSYADIRDIGKGRFSHWDKQGFIFSSSDNSDPNTNGRAYWAIVPIDKPSK